MIDSFAVLSHATPEPSRTGLDLDLFASEIVTITVPDGMDGRCWSFRELVLGQLWFFNVPNCLASAPQSLLLPREVARRRDADPRL